MHSWKQNNFSVLQIGTLWQQRLRPTVQLSSGLHMPAAHHRPPPRGDSFMGEKRRGGKSGAARETPFKGDFGLEAECAFQVDDLPLSDTEWLYITSSSSLHIELLRRLNAIQSAHLLVFRTFSKHNSSSRLQPSIADALGDAIALTSLKASICWNSRAFVHAACAKSLAFCTESLASAGRTCRRAVCKVRFSAKRDAFGLAGPACTSSSGGRDSRRRATASTSRSGGNLSSYIARCSSSSSIRFCVLTLNATNSSRSANARSHLPFRMRHCSSADSRSSRVSSMDFGVASTRWVIPAAREAEKELRAGGCYQSGPS